LWRFEGGLWEISNRTFGKGIGDSLRWCLSNALLIVICVFSVLVILLLVFLLFVLIGFDFCFEELEPGCWMVG
jgi:hypothetical protein